MCGGRDFDDMALVERTLDALVVTEIIEGGAKGADALAERWAEARGVTVREAVRQNVMDMIDDGSAPVSVLISPAGTTRLWYRCALDAEDLLRCVLVAEGAREVQH